MKQYIKPCIEILSAHIYAVMEGTSRPEGHQVDSGTVAPGDDVFMSKGDDEGDAWPSYSAWDE